MEDCWECRWQPSTRPMAPVLTREGVCRAQGVADFHTQLLALGSAEVSGTRHQKTASEPRVFSGSRTHLTVNLPFLVPISRSYFFPPFHLRMNQFTLLPFLYVISLSTGSSSVQSLSCDTMGCSMPDFPVCPSPTSGAPLTLPEGTSNLPHFLAWEEGSVCSYCGQLPNAWELLASSAFFLRGLSSFLPKPAFRKSQSKVLCGEGRPVSGWAKPSPLNAKNNLS